MSTRGEVRVGTSGWNYPTNVYGAWTGIFYPYRQGQRIPGTRAKFDELEFYATHFDCVELNTTFYGPPAAKTARAWVERTPPGFLFAAKLYQIFTHKRQATQADIDTFRRGMDPLAEAGRLGPVLCQFPASFTRDTGLEYLEWLLSTFPDYQLAVELRHRSWSDAFGDTIGLLNDHQAALVQIDEPQFRTSIAQNLLPNIRTFYYLRLHGRNAATWWRHRDKGERYDYLYSPAELKGFAETLTSVRELVPRAFVLLNNHAEGKSAANALQLQRMLDVPIAGDYEPVFVERYPEVAHILAGR